MPILENISLAKYTTFKIGGPARFFCLVTDEDEARQAVEFAKEKKGAGGKLGKEANFAANAERHFQKAK